MNRSTPLRRQQPTASTSVAPTACEVCAKLFFRKNGLSQKVCGARCAAKVPAIARKAEREADKARLAELKPAHQADLTQGVINDYVRLRDAGLGCVSCDLPATWGGQWHASHLRSRGAASALRFHLWNIHKSCSVCNNYRSGNATEYEARLRARIGDEKVDWLKAQNQIARYPVAYLKRLRKVFAKKTRRLEMRRSNGRQS